MEAKKWKEKTFLEKTADIISWIALVVFFIFFLNMKSSGAWEYSENVYKIAVVVITVCQSYSFWKTNRSLAYMGIVAGVLVLASVVVDLFV